MATGALMVIVGVWLLLQAFAGDLSKRLLSYRRLATSSGAPAGAAA